MIWLKHGKSLIACNRLEVKDCTEDGIGICLLAHACDEESQNSSLILHKFDTEDDALKALDKIYIAIGRGVNAFDFTPKDAPPFTAATIDTADAGGWW